MSSDVETLALPAALERAQALAEQQNLPFAGGVPPPVAWALIRAGEAALVDVRSGELLSDRIKLPTPAGGEPEDIATVVVDLVGRLDADDATPIGVTFPAIVKHGRTLSAANVSAWRLMMLRRAPTTMSWSRPNRVTLPLICAS